MGHRSWFTKIDSAVEFGAFIHAFEMPPRDAFSYSDYEYTLKVKNSGPFEVGSTIIAWSSDSDQVLIRFPYLLRQQTQLLDIVNRKFPVVIFCCWCF